MPKVSALTAASTPLTGTEIVPLVQGGNSRRATVHDLRGPVASEVLLQNAVTAASQTNIDFTGVPSWVNRIAVHFLGLSTNGTSRVQVQIGDSGGIENTNYLGSSSLIGTGSATVAMSAGFILNFDAADVAAATRQGTMFISRITGNTWAASGSVGLSDTTRVCVFGGTKALSDTLTQVRITTVSGADTFDAGSVALSWE